MALTKSAWTDATVSGLFTSTCTVVCTTAENDAYTLKTSTDLDPTKPWILLYSCAATPDAQALPLELYVGYSTSFAISSDGATLATTDGGMYVQLFDDVVLAVSPLKYVFYLHPNLGVADVVTVAAIATGPKVTVPVAPFYAFNLNGGSTLAATTHTFTIVQDQS